MSTTVVLHAGAGCVFRFCSAKVTNKYHSAHICGEFSPTVNLFRVFGSGKGNSCGERETKNTENRRPDRSPCRMKSETCRELHVESVVVAIGSGSIVRVGVVELEQIVLAQTVVGGESPIGF